MKLSVFFLTFIAITMTVTAEVTPPNPTQLTFGFLGRRSQALRTPPPKRFRRSPDTKVNGGISIANGQPAWNAAVQRTLLNKNDKKVDILAGAGGDFRHQPQVHVNLASSFPKTNVNVGANMANGRPNSWNAAVEHTMFENKHGKIVAQAGVGGPFGHRPEGQAAIIGQFNIPG